MDHNANRNTYWAHMLVDELWRAGLRAVVIAPGSRSTPLALAFASQPGLSVFVHPDERGAAFYALGLGVESGQPAAVLCTSGTAAANFYPAVVEAHQSQIPLLVLTADRPPELRDSGSNQTIDQVKLFGSYVRWAVEAPLPEAAPKANTLQALRSLASRALAATQAPQPGPVHINLPFRKPLEPTPVPADIPEPGIPARARHDDRPFVTISHGQLMPTAAQLEQLSQAIHSAQRGLIYCGPRCPAGDFPGLIYQLSQATGFPILADALSGVRFHPDLPVDQGLVLGGYETFLKSPALRRLVQPDLLLQFGAVPTSGILNEYFAALENTIRIQVQANGAWSDDTFNTSAFLWADPVHTIRALLPQIHADHPQIDLSWQAAWQRAERLSWQAITDVRQAGFFEGALLADILAALRPGDSLFSASSLPVRHLDQFCQPSSKPVRLFANRGASGIDGTIACAAGVASRLGPNERLVLVIGDLAFYHDLNSLLLLKKLTHKLTVVLINNDGGGIFHRLPIAGFEPYFSQLFLTSHGLQFEHAAHLFGLSYQSLSDLSLSDQSLNFQAIVRQALDDGHPQIIEITTDSAAHEAARRQISNHFEQLFNTPDPEI